MSPKLLSNICTFQMLTLLVFYVLILVRFTRCTDEQNAHIREVFHKYIMSGTGLPRAYYISYHMSLSRTMLLTFASKVPALWAGTLLENEHTQEFGRGSTQP